MRDAHRICPVCEAGCGLNVSLDGAAVVRIRANHQDRLSEGHLCPKGVALAGLHDDPRRIRQPRVRDADGSTRTVTWQEAFGEAARRLADIRAPHGADSVAVYVGNPTAHNVGLSKGLGIVAGALGSRNFYSASSVDQMPKQLAADLMFGDDWAIPVPDILHTDCLLMLGANPAVSNGSLWMVPKFREKVRALHQRGGQLIVVDPRRTETARLADQHLAVRPGSDAWLLAGLINHLAQRGRRVPPRYRTKGEGALFDALSAIALADAAARTGVSEASIRELADRLAAARHPVVYGRVGTTLQAFGTLTSFLVEVLNLQLGALDSNGGAMFGEQYFMEPGKHTRSGVAYGRWHSRVSGRPEVGGQLPVACLAEEIETPGEGRIRALVCFAGNPVLSNPDSARLQRALESLECIVAVDIFDTETARLADVLLPGTSPFEEGHYEHLLGAFGWKNVARYTAPVMPVTDRPDEWALCLQLAFGVKTGGRVATSAELAAFEDEVIAGFVRRHVDDPQSAIHGRDVQEILGRIGPARGVERLLDVGIRAGHLGDAFGRREGLSLERMLAHPDGIETSALRPRLDAMMGHVDGRIDLAPELILAEIGRLRRTPAPKGLLLVGRRNIRTNNSWLHGVAGLDKGAELRVVEMHVEDADARGIRDGDTVRVFNANGSFEARALTGTEVASGVIVFPHGFADANYNRLAAAAIVDEPSGTSALNGLEVDVERIAARA